MKKFVYLLAIVCLGLWSCQKEPILTLNTPSSISFNDQGGTQSISFTTNRNWTIQSSETWCKVTPSSGTATEASTSISINCDPNTTYDARTCTVTLKAEGLSETITVSQETNLGLIVSPTSFNITKAAQTIEVEVRANVKYMIDIDSSCKDWVKHTSTRALGTNILVFQISENEAYDERVGQVTIRQSDGILAETVYIRQQQTDGLYLTTPEYFLSNNEQTISVEVQANVEFDVISDEDWIKIISNVETRGLKTNIVTLSVSKNDTYIGREASISFQQINGPLVEKLTIYQAPEEILIIEQSEYDITDDAQSLTIDLQTNVDYVVSTGADWITINNNPEPASKRIYLTIKANETFGPREAEVIIKAKNSQLQTKVNIKQSQGWFSVVTKPAGTLLDQIGISNVSRVKALFVKGDLNGTDFVIIKRMSSLSLLNLENANIVEGGQTGDSGYYTYKDTFSESMFSNTTIKELIIPKSLRYIDNIAFSYSNIISISDIPGYIEIRNGAFHNCPVRSIRLGEGITRIGNGTFYASGLVSVSLPSTIKTIGNLAFCYSYSLTTINIPPHLESIGDQAFEGTKITSITLPETMKSIGLAAFRYCSNLKEIHIKAKPSSLTKIDRLFADYNNVTVYIPKGTFKDYYMTELGNFKNLIEE